MSLQDVLHYEIEYYHCNGASTSNHEICYSNQRNTIPETQVRIPADFLAGDYVRLEGSAR